MALGYGLEVEEEMFVFRTDQTDAAEHEWSKISEGNIILYSQLPRCLNEGNYRKYLRGELRSKYWLFSINELTPSISLYIKKALSQSPHCYENRPRAVAPIVTWTACNQ